MLTSYILIAENRVFEILKG